MKYIFRWVFTAFVVVVISFIFTVNVVQSVTIAVIAALLITVADHSFSIIKKRNISTRPMPAVIWLTGLSGAGKTTIAKALNQQFKKVNIEPILLDGDEIRNSIKLTGFDEASRKKHNISVGYAASLFEKQGKVVIVSLISPYEGTRNDIRKMCQNFIEVYIATDLATCIERDTKGLYKKAMEGEIKDFTGISAPYEIPQNPEILIDTQNISVAACTQIIIDFYRNKARAHEQM